MNVWKLLGVLLAIALIVAVVGAAAVVIVPASLVALILVLVQPHGVGARIRAWRGFARAKGLEPQRRLATFAAALVFYGVVAPSFCFAILVSAVTSSNSGSTATDVTPSPGPPLATETAAPTFAPSPPSPLATPVPTAAPVVAPAPRDPCHAGGVSYCVLNPAVTQATIGSTICVSGWTKSIRPAESYTENLKSEQIASEGLPGGMSSYEEDHRMPLELGGAPSDPGNLSPESPPSPNPKDSDETRLKREVCAGQLTLAQAQQQLVATWLVAYPGYRQ